MKPRRGGFTLLEMLIVMTALTLTTTLLTLTLLGGLKLMRSSDDALQRLGDRQALADMFRADVAGASEAPPRWQEETAGAACVILRRSADRVVVYRWVDGRLERAEYADEQVRRHDVAVGGRGTEVEFGTTGRLLALRFFTVAPDGHRLLASEIVAALGGDLQ
jgi:prepilin-type N-terminal cleavage/methylation domain-containing protein